MIHISPGISATNFEHIQKLTTDGTTVVNRSNTILNRGNPLRSDLIHI